MIPVLYRGSVKDVLGPLPGGVVVFDYSDAYSVFDWGRMPDVLPDKGAALAVLAAHIFERLERPETWREFSKSQVALELRKANRFGVNFHEIGERLSREGLRTHYLGTFAKGESVLKPEPLNLRMAPVKQLAVRHVSIEKPVNGSVLGRGVPDYSRTRAAAFPRLIPLEVVFRFFCPPGSSLIERAQQNPAYLAERGFSNIAIEAGAELTFPVMELFTKLESTDRPVGLGEALAISGLSTSQLDEVFLQTAWVAGWLKDLCGRSGLALADGKLEWGISKEGNVFLVDAIGPDELRILKDGVQLSKEFLRTYYRTTPWYELVQKAKTQAVEKGVLEWKRFVISAPPYLPAKFRELASELYRSLANRLTGHEWFRDAWPLEKVIDGIRSTDELGPT